MEKIVGLKDLRQNVEKYASEVKKGKSFIVMRRSKPLFKISPPEDDGVWETVVDFTKIKKGGVPAEDVLKALKKMQRDEAYQTFKKV